MKEQKILNMIYDIEKQLFKTQSKKWGYRESEGIYKDLVQLSYKEILYYLSRVSMKLYGQL